MSDVQESEYAITPAQLRDGAADISKDVVGFRFVRIIKNEFRFYTPIYFDSDEKSTTDQKVRRMIRWATLTCKPKGDCSIVIDLLDSNDDPIQEMEVDKRAFDFLRSKYKFKWERN